MYIWLCKDTGAMNRPPTPGGVFVAHFVGVRCIIANRWGHIWKSVSSVIANHQQHYRKPLAAVGVRFIVPAYTYSPRIRNPFEMPSRNVRNVFILCMLHIHHAKVWFLRHKSMVFGVQKPPFYIAKTRVCQNVHILFLCTKPRLSQVKALLFPKVFMYNSINLFIDF